MDEIGRGTSTYDGLALADACARHLAAVNRCYTLFATHYFELTALAEPGSGIANVHLDAVEHGDTLVFMHAVKDGPADRSFGLQVAALAGLPQVVVQQARARLAELEQRGRDAPCRTDDAAGTGCAAADRPVRACLCRAGRTGSAGSGRTYVRSRHWKRCIGSNRCSDPVRGALTGQAVACLDSRREEIAMNNALTDDVYAQLEGAPLHQMAQQLGVGPAQMAGAVSAALPLLLGTLGRNASEPQGAEALFGALQKDHAQLDPGDVLSAVLGGGQADGGKILGHVFGGQQPLRRRRWGRPPDWVAIAPPCC